MKRHNIVFNARALRSGRGIAAWAASGMNWGEGPLRDRVEAAANRALRDPAQLERIGREVLALLSAGDALTQTAAAQIVLGEPA